MAKTQGPLLSESASGTFGKVLTFSRKKFRQIVRFQRPPSDKKSLAQLFQRTSFSFGLLLWYSLPDEEKELWRDIARNGVALAPP